MGRIQITMKTIIVFASLMVAVMAYYDSSTVSAGFNTYGLNCFADRCQACKAHFGGAISSFDCEGQCGLCALCPTVMTANVPGCNYCKGGVEACIETCNKGKKICSACASSCN